MRTIKELAGMDGRVYVYLGDEEAQMDFLKAATEEGFTFADGVKPLERQADDYYALNADGTINFIGYVGRMAYRNASEVGGKKLIRVDYGAGSMKM